MMKAVAVQNHCRFALFCKELERDRASGFFPASGPISGRGIGVFGKDSSPFARLCRDCALPGAWRRRRHDAESPVCSGLDSRILCVAMVALDSLDVNSCYSCELKLQLLDRLLSTHCEFVTGVTGLESSHQPAGAAAGPPGGGAHHEHGEVGERLHLSSVCTLPPKWQSQSIIARDFES